MPGGGDQDQDDRDDAELEQRSTFVRVVDFSCVVFFLFLLPLLRAFFVARHADAGELKIKHFGVGKGSTTVGADFTFAVARGGLFLVVRVTARGAPVQPA